MAEIPTRRTAYEPTEYDLATTAPTLLKRVSWGAIFAGALLALGFTILLGLLGAALGVGGFDPATEDVSLTSAAWFVGIFYLLTTVLAYFLGGSAAARLAGFPSGATAMLHGAAVWALGTVVAAWMATGAVTGAVNTAVGAAGSAASGIADAVSGNGSSGAENDEGLSREARQAAREARREAIEIANQAGLTGSDVEAAEDVLSRTAEDMIRTPGDMGADFNEAIDDLFTGENAVVSEAERDALARQVALRTGVTEAEARRVA
ncbi:MAG: hypothetical protein WA906_04325, partial [Pacificimonas sp.]